VQAVSVGEFGGPAGQPAALLVVTSRQAVAARLAAGGVPFVLALAAPDALQARVGAGVRAARLQDRAEPADRLGLLLAFLGATAAAVVEEERGGLLGAGATVALGEQEPAERWGDVGGGGAAHPASHPL